MLKMPLNTLKLKGGVDCMRVKSQFTVVNNLDNYLNKEVGKRMSTNGGEKVLKTDVIGEVAEFCGVGWENINRVKRGIVTPSLTVALRIAKYFNVNVEDIFEIIDNKE